MTGGSTPWLQAAAVLAALMAAAVWASPTWPGEPQRRPTMTVVPGGGPVSERPLVEIVGRVLREDRSPIADARAMLIGIDEVCRAAARDLPAFTKGAVGVIRSVQTDAEGSYSFDAVPPGRYTVTVVPLAAEPGSTGQFVVGDCLRYKCDPLCLRTIPEADGVRATRDVCFDDLPELLACHVAISPVAATDLDGRIVHIVERGPQFVRLGPPAGAAADAAGDRRVVAIRLPADPLPPETTATLVSVRARPEQLIRYVGWAPTAGTDRAEFAAVPPGEYFRLLATANG